MGPWRERAQRVAMGRALALATAVFACSSSDYVPPCHKRTVQVGVGATFNVCPEITSFQALPTEVAVGTDVQLAARASDPDSNNLAFSWEASVGSVDDVGAPETTYRCSAPGPVTLTLTVTDGICEDRASISVFCDGCASAGGAAGPCDAGRDR
jgi:hypothetical protein